MRRRRGSEASPVPTFGRGWIGEAPTLVKPYSALPASFPLAAAPSACPARATSSSTLRTGCAANGPASARPPSPTFSSTPAPSSFSNKLPKSAPSPSNCPPTAPPPAASCLARCPALLDLRAAGVSAIAYFSRHSLKERNSGALGRSEGASAGGGRGGLAVSGRTGAEGKVSVRAAGEGFSGGGEVVGGAAVGGGEEGGGSAA